MKINGDMILVLVAWGSIFLVASLAPVCVVATTYTVGDTSGWTLGVDYNTWAKSKSIAAGDTLVFNYASGMHTVDEVQKSDYDSCTTGNSITSDSSGATNIPLKTTGTRYFICGVAGHCAAGMKLAITASSAGSTVITPPSSPATTTSPPTVPAVGTTTPPLTGSNGNNCPPATTNPGNGIYYYPYNWSMGTKVIPSPCFWLITSILAFTNVVL